MVVFHRQRPTRFDKRGNLTIILMLKMHAVAIIISMGKIVGGAVRHCDLVAKIKIAKFFFWHVGDSQKFMLAKISRYTVSLLTEQLKYVLVLTFTLFQ